MLRLENIGFSYSGGSRALMGVNARIDSGVTLLVGPNAGGKTTLLRLLAGLLVPDAGRVLKTGPEKGLFADDLRRMGRMLMQDADPQILGADVAEDVMLGKAASALGDRFEAEAAKLIEQFGLGDLWHGPVSALSYGQKRKLCLVNALLASPEILLLDEPFAGLDYPAARELRAFIRENRRKGLTQVVSTHELEPVFDLADWLLVVEEGMVPAEGRPEDLRDALYGWSVRPPGGGWE